MGEMVQYPANGTRGSGYLALPQGGVGPGVLVLQEWWGLVDHIKQVTDRLAGAGFVALAPDFYAGQTTKSPDEAAKLFLALNIDRAAMDLRAAASFLRSHASVAGSRIGALGFCMGGQLALYAAVVAPDQLGAVVDFYGIHPKVPIDPAKVRAPVLGHFATRDQSVSLPAIHQLAAAVEARGGSFTAHEYEADHAFFNDARADVYHPTAAALAWQRSVDFLRRHLQG